MASLSRRGSGGRPKPHMNVPPPVAAVLVLLIIFMIVIPAMTEGVNLEVPAVANVDEETSDDAPEPVMLSVNRFGTVLLDDAVVPEGQLRAHLERAHRQRPRARLVLRGDRGVSYREVRALFAAAQTVGFPGVSPRGNQQSGDGAPGAD